MTKESNMANTSFLLKLPKRDFRGYIQRMEELVIDGSVKATRLFSEPSKGARSKLESRYGADLKIRQLAGEILWYKHEFLKFRVGHVRTGKGRITSSYYLPDYTVLHSDGTIELIEIKGGYPREAGMAKFKSAAMIYPFLRWVMWQKKGKNWNRIYTSIGDEN